MFSIKFLIKYITLFILILPFTGCTARMDIKTDNAQPMLSVYGMITGLEEHQKITLSSTAPYFSDEENERITGANVTISGDNGDLWKLYDNDEKGVYKTENKYKALAGVNYTLEIVCDFDLDGIAETYTAQTYMYDEIKIDSMKIESFNFMNKNYFNTLVSVMEPIGKNYYLYRYYVNEELQLNKISKYYITDDSMFDGQYISNISFGTFHHIKDTIDYDDDKIKNMTFFTPGDKIEIEMSEISKLHYNFIYQCQKEMSGENPMFGGPAANIISNIKGGACGFFGAFNGGRATAIVPTE